MSAERALDHPYNREHACLSCAYTCECRTVMLTCETCGQSFPPRAYTGTSLAFCGPACDPGYATRWATPFVSDHEYVAGSCETADYLHVQAPRLITREEAARLGLGRRGPVS
jgi:hypothetical protein